MHDVQHARFVEVQAGAEGQLWINVDGVCVFRAQKFDHLVIDDDTVEKSLRSYDVGFPDLFPI